MITPSYNSIYNKQNKTLIPATFKKAIISAIYPNTFKVDVYFVGNAQTIIKQVQVASSIDINEVSVGDYCRVDCFSESNPNDMVVAYTYGKNYASGTPFIKSGSSFVTSSGGAVAHGLGVIPSAVILTLTQNGAIYEYAPADANYIYVKSNSSPSATSFNWSVLKV
jgi:hypothetical protein